MAEFTAFNRPMNATGFSFRTFGTAEDLLRRQSFWGVFFFLKRRERCGCKCVRYQRGLNDVFLIHLHTSHIKHWHTSPPGTPFPPISPESGPSLLTERITTAERVIRGCEGLREKKQREGKRRVSHSVANSCPHSLPLKFHFLLSDSLIFSRTSP